VILTRALSHGKVRSLRIKILRSLLAKFPILQVVSVYSGKKSIEKIFEFGDAEKSLSSYSNSVETPLNLKIADLHPSKKTIYLEKLNFFLAYHRNPQVEF
jgi:hypothetical protein